VLDHATSFVFDAAKIVFGPGSSAETGPWLREFGATRALLVCDRFVADSGLAEQVRVSLREAGVDCEVYDGVAGEPNDSSVRAAAAAACGGFDGFVGIGGGSALDTAKLCALHATHGGDVLDYISAPLGRGQPVPGPLLPLVALPTTAGTGSEVTTVAVVDLPAMHTKAGVSHRFLRPSLAIVDPLLTISCPPAVTAATGLDALFHALEAYTALRYDARPQLPLAQRPPYQGSNPFSDVLCEQAIGLIGRNLRTAVADGGDVPARTAMSLAATMAGIAFASAGVHLPHALAYPVASLAHGRRKPDGGLHQPIAHGFAVAATALAAYRLIQERAPERCQTASRLLDGGASLADSLVGLFQDVGAPTSLVGSPQGPDDLPALISGALAQRRLLIGSPVPTDVAELEHVFRGSM
jgi:alcohol dehydrogenase class IV